MGFLRKPRTKAHRLKWFLFLLIGWEVLPNYAWSEWKSECHLFETNNIAKLYFMSEWNKSWNSYLLCWTEYFEKYQCRNKEILNFGIFTTEIFLYGQTEVFCLTHRSCIFDEAPSISFEKVVWPRNTSPQESTWVWDIYSKAAAEGYAFQYVLTENETFQISSANQNIWFHSQPTGKNLFLSLVFLMGKWRELHKSFFLWEKKKKKKDTATLNFL